MTRTIVICEDDIQEAQRTHETLKAFEEQTEDAFEITTYHSGADFLKAIEKREVKPDLVFQDIELGTMTGIEVAQVLNQEAPRCHIVYLTNYIQYATDVYTTDHEYFVVKGDLENRMGQIWEKLLRIEEEEGMEVSIDLKNSGTIVLNKEEIFYAERWQRATCIFTKKGPIETRIKLDDLEKLLGNGQFVRCHNSYIVGFRYIEVYKRETLELEGGIMIPVSRRYYQQVKEAFLKWSQTHLF